MQGKGIYASSPDHFSGCFLLAESWILRMFWTRRKAGDAHGKFMLEIWGSGKAAPLRAGFSAERPRMLKFACLSFLH
ncbi:hypothetical protein CSB45_02065 [candidate division KSB3 bacterium]|uniref:Uncharacterized protein n=1 Tax=candidate division KSB3 bacterium TaxID=2044937 RepID=A0A2G6EA18_9BACT|nr:MAG: hypothetical protein CSB45_02065 [candidate division KSB3 bacterium]PIE30868.1 MAG: hypothetical protein CSA57_00675 [candidate division KSB3 bacterium]